MRNCWQWRWLWWWLRVQWWWSWRGRCYQRPGSLEHCWSHPRSSPQIYFLEESKYCWQQPTLLWVVLVVTKANTSDRRTNPDWGGIDRGRWWSALSGRGSWRRICSILRLDLLPLQIRISLPKFLFQHVAGSSADHTFSILLSSLHRENTKSEISEPIN